MNDSLRKTGSRRGSGAGRWLAREPRRWPVSVRMALVAVIAVVGFTLVGPAATASAAPPPPTPASDSSGREPSRLERLKWQMHETWVAATLDGHDPYYQWKLLRQIFAKRVFAKLEKGSVSLSFKDDGPNFVQDTEEFIRRSQETPNGLRRQLTKAKDKIHNLNQKIDQAQTPAERKKLESDREVARKQEKDVAKRYRKLMETQPDAENGKAKIQSLDTKISDLRNKITSLEEETKKSRPDRREKQRQLETARANLAEAEAERRRLQGPPDDDSDNGGTRTTPRDPKTPPKGPGSTNPTTTSTTSTTPKGNKGTTAVSPTVTPKGNKGTTAVSPTVTPKGNKGTTAVSPTVTPKQTTSTTAPDPTMSWKGGNSLKTPKAGFRGSTGTNQMADAIAGVIADGISQDYAAHLDRRNQQLLEQARKDPALAKRIIDDYNEIKDNNDIEVLFRAFDTSKGFTQDATRQVAPELIKSQKALDTAKAIADKSNADPFYQQARTECAGYDTCVTDRTAKLRKQNAKAIAESTKKAKKSNADPLYQQANTECAGYSTCVTDRVAKLRKQNKQNAKAIAESTKKAKKSNADPLYQQANTECAGYSTCVTDRVAKLRKQNKQNAKAIAESTKKAKKSNADPLYQQANTECAGYSTCVTDRVAKLRAQKKTTTATTTTRTEQHKQPQKKTQTTDYRGKGGVKASAA
ncbi:MULTISPECIES: hypothetical protein [unclassified Streptomyces]|uniref:hypothetical protein n=1 Tax=unclassified Streptomyces TaxID=2593676 RepID=UPI00224D19E5|nr:MULTISPECIES: hypothetical protein [unclassified Streptomyces]MCX4871059.1 hypothetical protein [Streptomyces sp. NBC_00906]MCX4902712.1 hypothetical protein [Streptomyces sp. NBC_00892]